MALAHPQVLADVLRFKLSQNPERIRKLLGGWVSELEPVVVYDSFSQVVGLTAAGHEVGGLVSPDRIYVKG